MLKGPGLLPHISGKAKKLVVLFHGYGSNGEDLIELARYWSPLLPETEFLAPNGPDICETYSFGYQWFGLKEFTHAYVQAGLTQARSFLRDYLLEALIKRELMPGDLALVGFSQGGMVALDMMFAIPQLRGIISYSGGFYPPMGLSLVEPLPEVLLVHGDADTCVPYTAFSNAQTALKKQGVYPQTLTCSGLGHSIDEEGLKKGGEFLTYLFAKEKPAVYEKVIGAVE